MDDFTRFEQAFTEALLFTAPCDDEGNEPDYSEDDLSGEALMDIHATCHDFWRRFGCFITADICQDAFSDPAIQAGHDFVMSRNGHGCGFWEDEWPECYRDWLHKAAKSYGEFNVYEGDDGLLYIGG